ncbi:ABC transporter ATP-binding protein [Rhodococcus gordoniae]|uniref:ABC transporter ATP-binding protein n=1 Tax=Rhodococcus gordoniae TaxID=223392 RepID=A0A379LU72_9NOCA|nr:ABC transporter ATP-binding protein [Rhodococcus gordoniae]SUE13621.1 ABC transporter ATP-binding protein [Rhodococcus gordoniae]
MTITSPVVRARHLGMQFGDVAALTDADFTLHRNTIYGLLGRNGAGKTTLMQLLAGHLRPTTGSVEVFGADPYENTAVLQQLCFVADTQRHPDDLRVGHVLASAELLLPLWDRGYAERLAERFALPCGRKVKKLSRGMSSALGIVVGLASRAPVTIFDEPYLGLDAVARQMFYDELLLDYAERPRTVVLSTHLIDEVADLLEHVLVLDRGHLVVDEDTDTLRTRAAQATGPADEVARIVGDSTVLHTEGLGGVARTTFLRSDPDELPRTSGPVDVQPISLQDLVVHLHRTSASATTNEEASL